MTENWQNNYIPEPNSGCWIWLGYCDNAGYGRFHPFGRALGQKFIHRFMYELHKGEIPDGLDALHSCDNPPCCNPDHIFLGTQPDNMADKVKKGRCHDQSGEKSNSSRLTPSQVDDIRASSETQRILAERFGVSQSQISRIKCRNRWR